MGLGVVQLNAAVTQGASLGVDIVGAAAYQIVKLGYSDSGNAVTQVALDNPLPVQFSGGVTAIVSNFPAIQPVSQSGSWTVSVNNFPAGNSVNLSQYGGVNVGATNAQYVQPGTGATFPVSGTFWQATQPVSGTFWQTTQPVSLASSVAVTGTFWQATQPVSGTFWQATQPVSGTVTSNQGGAPWTVKPDATVWTLTGTSANVNLTNASVAVTGTFWQATQPVSGTVTANQGTANTAANAWTAKVTDGTNVTAVKAASTAAVAADPAVVVAVSPNNSVAVTGTFFQTTQPVSLTSTTVTGTVAVTQSGTWTDRVVGNAGAVLDSVTTAATTPANAVAVSVANVTTAPSLATGQSVALQGDWAGSVFTKPYRRSQTKAATGTFTSATATSLLAAQAAGVFADLGTISITQGLGTTANVYFTVNVSDGTAIYKFGMFSNDSVSVTPTGSQPVCITFDPPIPATTAATAWTVALSSATDAPTVNVTATFVLQKAS